MYLPLPEPRNHRKTILTNNMTTHLQREIEHLKNKLLELSAEVERSLSFAGKSLVDLDIRIAREVIDGDDRIDEDEVNIEEECLKILALYQPVAADLRFVIAVLKINADLERMGDLAVNICRYVIEIDKLGRVPVPTDFAEMCRRVQTLVSLSTESFLRRDVLVATEVLRLDKEIDRLNLKLIESIRGDIAKPGANVNALLYLFTATRTLERIGDYATNVAEDVFYMVEGQIIRHKNHGNTEK